MNVELAQHARHLQEATLEVNALLDGISDAALNWRPRPGAWSVGECVDHLVKTGEQFFPKVEEAMEKGRAAGKLSPGPFRHSFMGNMMVRSMEPPVRTPTKSKTTRFFTPEGTLTRSKLVEGLDNMHSELARLLVNAEGPDIKKNKAHTEVGVRLQ